VEGWGRVPPRLPLTVSIILFRGGDLGVLFPPRAQLRHPNIVRFYDFFDDNEELKIVMELVTGDDAFETMQKKVACDGASFGHDGRCLLGF
jgi:hypothetical protein